MPKQSPSAPSKKGKGSGSRRNTSPSPPPSESGSYAPNSAPDDSDNDQNYDPDNDNHSESEYEKDSPRGRSTDPKITPTSRKVENMKGGKKGQKAAVWTDTELVAMFRAATQHREILIQRKTKRNTVVRDAALLEVSSKYTFFPIKLLNS